MNDPLPTIAEVTLVDVNATLSRWPFRRLLLDQAGVLAAKLRSEGISKAWVGSFDALLHRDIEGVNQRLAEDCRQEGDGMFIPFGAINPMLPDWEEDVRRCHEVHKMPGVRLHPNYHGYKLDDPLFARLLDLCAQRSLVVQISAMMEDERTQHPLMRVAPVDLAPLPAAMAQAPTVRVMLLNALHTARGGEPLTLLAKCEKLFLDIATLEGVGGIANLIERYPADRICFGTYAPLFYPESALFKLKESALEGEPLQAIASKNAMRILQNK